jgi:hypothetical protein
MKDKKKHKKAVPKVHVFGDLEDVKKLVEVVSKKKSVVIFRNGDNGTCYADVEKVMVEYTKTDIVRLEKDFRVIYFDFFPEKRSAKPADKKNPVAGKSETVKKKGVKAKVVKKTNTLHPRPVTQTARTRK